MCPWGPGPNPNVLSYFSQFPLNNGFTEGDGYNLGSYSFSSPAPGSLNTSILKLDYLPSDEAAIVCARATCKKIHKREPENFPGQATLYQSRRQHQGNPGWRYLDHQSRTGE